MGEIPNLFVVGAPKVGTTSLYSYLCLFQDVYMSKVKEPNHFSIEIVPDNFYSRPIRNRDDYLRLFAKGRDFRYRGEASPTYLLDPNAPELIKTVSPAAKIVITIRDPVDLAFSFYFMLARKGVLSNSFSDAVVERLERQPLDWSRHQLRVEFGFYADSIRRYFEAFGRESVLVIVFEQMTKDPLIAINQLATFLDCPAPRIDGRPDAFNVGGVARSRFAQKILESRRITRLGEKLVSPSLRRTIREKLLVKPSPKPILEESARTTLVDLYAEDVRQLRELLQSPLPWPNFEGN